MFSAQETRLLRRRNWNNLRTTKAKKIRPKMTLAVITMPKTRGVMPVVDVPLLDPLLVPEAEGDVEVWVTTVVDLSEVESGGVKRGAWVVEEEVLREEVDELIRLLAEDEIGRTDGVGVGTVEGGTEDGTLVVGGFFALVLVGTAGLKMLENKDSIGFSFSSADLDVDADAGADAGDVGRV